MKKLGFGFMRLPLTDPNDQQSVDFDKLSTMVDTFMENGFNYFDLAYIYHDGKCEPAFKQAVADRYPRDAYKIASKLTIMVFPEKEEQERIFEEQLELCGVDYFDYYMVHDINTDTLPIARETGSFDLLRRKKAEGKIKEMGFSFHADAETLDELLNENPDVDFVQLQLNYLDWESPIIQSRKCYEVARKHGKKITVMEPIKGGTLVQIPEAAEELFKACSPDASIASWAIRFVASLEGVHMVLSGMTALDQLEDNVSYMKDFKPMTEEEHEVLSQAIELINAAIAIPCTACRYCVAHCPRNIAIPECFSLYNSYKRANVKGFAIQLRYYMNLLDTSGNPATCIGCKKCEAACPQHLGIVDGLKDVVGAFNSVLGISDYPEETKQGIMKKPE